MNTPVAAPPFEIIDRTQIDNYQSDLQITDCQDCACAVSIPSTTSTQDNRSLNFHETLHTVPELRIEPIDNGAYAAIFNPTGESGIVVLNKASFDLLTQFNQPTKLDTVTPEYQLFSQETEHAVHRLIALGLIKTVNEQQHPNDEKNDLLTSWLHITNQCNLGCIYCYLPKTNEHMSEATGEATVDAIVRSAQRGGYSAIKLKYAGGEASLRFKTVYHIHDYAVQQCQDTGLNLHAVLLTNGVYLPADDIRELKERKIGVMVSLDSIDDSHNIQRPLLGGQSSVSQVLENIERLISNSMFPHLSITVTDENADSFADVVRFALARNLTFSINFFRDNDLAASRVNVQLSENRIIAGMKKVFKTIEQNLPKWGVGGMILDRGQLISPHEHVCGAAHDYLVVDHKGYISKCNMEMDKPVTDITHPYPLGVVRSSSIGLQNPSSVTKEGCQICSWRYYCSGGCPLETHRATGRYDLKSPNCNIYKAIFPEVLRLEGLRLLKYAGELETAATD